jgi:acetolactate synthase-1/2/3 large subunit
MFGSGCLADVKESLAAFYPKGTHESWHNKFKELYEIELEAVITRS